MVPRRPAPQTLACQITSLPKPWIGAFDMVTSLRPSHSIHDVRLDLIRGKGIVVRTVGNACSRTFINELELYSMSLADGYPDNTLTLMISFKEFKAAFELSLQLTSMVNIFFDKRENADPRADPGPLILQIPSVTGIETEMIISALIPDPSEEPSQTGPAITNVDASTPPHLDHEEPDHVSESDFSAFETEDEADETQIPPTPPKQIRTVPVL